MDPGSGSPEGGGLQHDALAAKVLQRIKSASGAVIGEASNVYVLGDTQEAADRNREIKSLGTQLFNTISLSNKSYVGRKKEMQELSEALLETESEPAARTVLIWGFGGMGKTQLMLRFARLYESVFSSIIWLDASSEASIRSSMVALAKRIAELSERKGVENQDEDFWIMQARLWLARDADPRWLLLMDNYDDPSDIPGHSSPNGYNIRQYFPQSFKGAIIITSRVNIKVFDHAIHVSKLTDPSEGLAILLQRSERQEQLDDTQQQEAEHLVDYLDGLPLALSTAGVYLRYAPDVTFGQFLDAYKQGWDNPAMHEEFPLEYQLSHETRTLFTTWNVSYDRLEKDHPDYARLLCLLVYFNPRSILFGLLQDPPEASAKWLKQLAANGNALRQAMRRLVEWSFLSFDTTSSTYSMHQCVHDWLRFKTKTQDHDGASLRTVCAILELHSCADGDLLRWNGGTRHLLHMADLIMSHDFEHQIGLLDEIAAYSLGKCSMALLWELKYKGALVICKQAFATLKLHGNPDSLLTADTALTLGHVYEGLGDLRESERVLEQAETILQRILGPQSGVTVAAERQLAGIKLKLGKYDEAETRYQKAYVWYKDSFGNTDSQTLDVLIGLGLLYKKKGKFDQAKAILQKVVPVLCADQTQQPHGLPVDAQRSFSFVKGTRVCIELGELEMAESFAMQRMTAFENEPRSTYNQVMIAVTFYDQGRIYRDQGRFQESKEAYKEALAGYKQLFDSDRLQINVLEIENELAIVSQKLLAEQRKPTKSR